MLSYWRLPVLSLAVTDIVVIKLEQIVNKSRGSGSRFLGLNGDCSVSIAITSTISLIRSGRAEYTSHWRIRYASWLYSSSMHRFHPGFSVETLVLSVEPLLSNTSLVRLVGIQPNETLKIMLVVSNNIQRESSDVHSLCSFHESSLNFSLHISRPPFQF